MLIDEAMFQASLYKWSCLIAFITMSKQTRIFAYVCPLVGSIEQFAEEEVSLKMTDANR